MTSARLSRRRQEPVDPRSFIFLDRRTAIDPFEQAAQPQRIRHSSASRASHSNSTDRHPSPMRPARQTNRLTESWDSFLSPSLVVPSHVDDVHAKQSKLEFIYPPSISIGPRLSDKPCSCHITMSYRSDPGELQASNYSRRDEITIFQETNDGFVWVVFKGFLKLSDSFTFRTQRAADDRFLLKFEINGSLDTILSACCEHPFRHGGRIDDGDSSFWIRTVQHYTSCAKCQASTESLPASDGEETVSEEDVSEEESDDEEEQSVVSIESTKQEKPKHAPLQSSTDSKTSSEGVVPTAAKAQPVPAPPPSTAVSKTPVEKPEDDVALLKYVDDVMQQALSKPPPSQAIAPRPVGNVENFTLLYIDQHDNNDLSVLRSIINFIRTVNDLNTLPPLLAACTNERVIVVIPLEQAQALLAQLQQDKCVHSIYLLSNQTHSPSWINGHDKVAGLYRNIDSIRDHLATTLSPAFARVIPVEITAKDSTTDVPFTYCQLLKETMLCEDEESDLKKDMLAFCHTHYADNATVLREIDEFTQSFVDKDCIAWCTRSCFLTKILSRAFRTQEIDLLFKMRHIIQCLHKQIQSLASKQSITCYAMLEVDEETIEKFRDNVSGLVLFRSFVLATTERPKPDTRRCVVFSLRVEPGCAVNIEKMRSSDCPFDVLINLDTVFRVVSIDDDNGKGHTVHLQSVSHDDAHFQQLTGSMRKETTANVVILQLTRLLIQTKHYWENDYLVESIYQDRSFENDATLLASLAAAHHLLGNVNETSRDFEGSRRQFFKALRAFRLFASPTNALLSASYNNSGSMFYQEDQNENALKFHQMALQCQLKASSPDMDAVATYASNIGAVYIDMKEYAEAMKHLKRAVVIREKMPKKDNPKHMIALLQKLSSCLWKMEKAEEALEYYKKTLDLQLQLPNPADQPLSVTYYNLSTAYTKLGDYDNAVECAEKSVECLKRISPNHPELEENQAQLELVRQKQWLKQVLTV